MATYEEELLKEFISVSTKAGKRAIEYIKENPLEIEKKPDDTYVTQVNKKKTEKKVDVELNTFILDILGAKFPEITIVGEESTEKKIDLDFSKGKFIFVDPIGKFFSKIQKRWNWKFY
jgi:3'-phosphoadenosine 5'-phosphosulfate (PAPS) 3'-phosphatase